MNLSTPAMRLVTVLARTHDLISEILPNLANSELSQLAQRSWNVTSVRISELIRAITVVDDEATPTKPDRWTDAGLLGPELDFKIALFESASTETSPNIRDTVSIVASIIESFAAFDELVLYANPIVSYLRMIEVCWPTHETNAT